MWATFGFLFFLTGTYPLARAIEANRRTALAHALAWTVAAWVAWMTAFLADVLCSQETARSTRYVALCMTGCAGVAVLGARRPGVTPWNFVVIGLLAVLLAPLAESLVAGKELVLEGPRLFFLSATLVVGILNYLPTRLGPAALLLGVPLALEGALLAGSVSGSQRFEAYRPLALLLLSAAPWAAFERLRHRPAPLTQFDLLWLDFRDRFGLVWSQRLRDQFNHSAQHAGWPVILRWRGLRLTDHLPAPNVQDEMVVVLRALLKRFGTPEGPDDSG